MIASPSTVGDYDLTEASVDQPQAVSISARLAPQTIERSSYIVAPGTGKQTNETSSTRSHNQLPNNANKRENDVPSRGHGAKPLPVPFGGCRWRRTRVREHQRRRHPRWIRKQAVDIPRQGRAVSVWAGCDLGDLHVSERLRPEQFVSVRRHDGQGPARVGDDE